MTEFFSPANEAVPVGGPPVGIWRAEVKHVGDPNLARPNSAQIMVRYEIIEQILDADQIEQGINPEAKKGLGVVHFINTAGKGQDFYRQWCDAMKVKREKVTMPDPQTGQEVEGFMADPKSAVGNIVRFKVKLYASEEYGDRNKVVPGSVALDTGSGSSSAG